VGTFYLKEYFKTECIKLSIDDAIGKYLVNYNYYPIVCTYSDEEYDQLIEKNESLNKVLKSSVSENVKSKARRDYVEYRYTLNSKMESKFHALKSLMRKYVNDNHFLVYSGKVRTDDEGDFIEGSHSMMLKAIDKTTRILGKNCLNMKISRITYEEKASDRKKIIEDFNNGDIQGIVAISCLDEGIDIPSIKTAVIMSSSDNPREYIQRRGRVLRLFPGKDHADIYDFVVFPRDLDDYRIGGIYSEIELMVLSKEIKRMKEFSRISLNKDETDNLLQEITKVYGMTIEKIMDIAGSEDDEQC
jgi:superfamily II DNA or RNA helicase